MDLPPENAMLDMQVSTTELALEMRKAHVNEKRLAMELYRGIKECPPGIDHIRYLKMAKEWLGYRDIGEDDGSEKGISTLAGAVAGALAGARRSGVFDKKIIEGKKSE